MRRYEMMVILTDLLDEEAAQSRYEWIKSVLQEQGGTVIDESWWGKREFTYEIAKRSHGWYAVVEFEATSEAVTELERQLKINDEVVRFKTVRPDLRVRRSA